MRLRRRIRRWQRLIGRRWDRLRAPWPIVSECHSFHLPDHSCEQCQPTHSHRWKAWPKAPRWAKAGPGVPIRCRVCGARKCDARDCQERRHDHTHIDGMAFPVIFAGDTGGEE